MSQQNSIINIILTEYQIKQRMPLLKGKIPSDQKMFVHFFQREKGKEKEWRIGQMVQFIPFSGSLALTEPQ